MSTRVFPVMPGLSWDVVRTPMFNTTVNENVSGKETAVAHWTYPRYSWELTYDVLRADPAHHEWQDLSGFFELVKGRADTFLFNDVNDNAVTGQAIATGDGVKTTFQLQRTFGSAIMPVLAPNVVTAAKVAGVDPTGWSVTTWASSTPGLLTFLSAPANGAAITADFSFYFPCRFDVDQISFNNFMTQLWAGKSITFRSVK